MIETIAYILAFMITLPLLVTVFIYKVIYKWTNKMWYAIHFSVDITTLLYIFSVNCIVYLLFDFNIIGYIFALLLFLLILCMIIHWRVYTDIIFMDVWKRFWKVSFLIFLLLHIILMVYGIFYAILGII